MATEVAPLPDNPLSLATSPIEDPSNPLTVVTAEHERLEVEPELPEFFQEGEIDEDTSDSFAGYTKEDEEQMYNTVEYKSSNLFSKVIQLESEHAEAIALLFSKVEVPINVPPSLLQSVGGSELYIEKINIGKGEEMKTFVTGVGKIPKSQRRLVREGGFGMRSRQGASGWPGKSPFTQVELLLLRRPLVLGWIRDVVLKSSDGSGRGQVSYISPDGTVVRSYKDLALALTNYPGGRLSAENFSFTARPIGGSKNEVVRMPQDSAKINRIVSEAVLGIKNSMQGGGLGAKRRRPMTYPSNVDNYGDAYGGNFTNGGNPMAKRRRRGRIVPQRNTLMEKMQANDSEGGLFGISAISEIFAGMEKADAERELEEYNQMVNLMEAEESMLDTMDEGEVMEDGKLVIPKDEILPCSIRCPGMTGKIPGLQCKRCLCLYHAECLAIPDDVDSANFLCSNCEGSESPPSNSHASPVKDSVYDLMQKMLELKNPGARSYAAPVPLRGFQNFGKGLSIKRVDPKGGSPTAQLRGGARRMLPKIPQLTSHNLTITPLAQIPRGQIPRVPTLSPINGPRNSIPIYKRGRGGNTLVDSIQINPQRHGNYSKQPFAPHKPVKPAYPIPNFGASFGTAKPVTSNIFRNYPQSVVSVGQKKFIVIPKAPSPSVMKLFERNKGGRICEEFGKDKVVLNQVFKYLMVKDLLLASRVNSVWKEVTSHENLWKVLRLKNTRIYDVDSFAKFVEARKTETIDFRKMLGFVDWGQLFGKLSTISSLSSLVLGAKLEELKELAETNCPKLNLLEHLS